MLHKQSVALAALIAATGLLLIIGLLPAADSSASPRSISPAQSQTPGAAPNEGVFPASSQQAPKLNPAGGVTEGDPLVRDAQFYARRSAHDPATNFTLADAAALRAQAADQLSVVLQNRPTLPTQGQAYSGGWTSVGPNPMILAGRADNKFDAMAGRIGALAIRSSAPYTLYLGGAQGGIWTLAYPYTGTWTPRTDALASMAIGSIALAPSNENIVYVGTGEGALSGDSYFGNGVLKSVDGGTSFTHISAVGYFTTVSISKIVVDPANPDIVYAGTVSGVGGSRAMFPPNSAPLGVWKSVDGGVNWTKVLTGDISDMVIDPQDGQTLYAALLSSGIYKTVNGGSVWTTAMTGLPAGYYDRFSLGISRPSVAVSATLYTGFDGSYNWNGSVWKSTNDAQSWSATNSAINGYCGGQCWYDNVVGVDPISPTIVYVLGLYNYNTGSGGVYRSMDGGTSWVDLGYDLHPDYHAIAIRQDDPASVAIGNDGGVWWSASRGGRLNVSDPLSATTWNNLNGIVVSSGATGPTVSRRTGLTLGQASSVAVNPAIPNRFYQGTQDNGTQRQETGTGTWYDTTSGDGGQVLVDPTDARYVYGEYYGISPYRFTDGAGVYYNPDGTASGSSKAYIASGINTNDRSEFYVPMIMDPDNSNRLFLGTYRVYRTNNAKAPTAGEVTWSAISGDLTSGCGGGAPNGAFGCYISALGKSAGAKALYAGTEEGWLWLTPDATADSPVWQQIDISGTLRNRPVAAFAVDRSNYRVVYAALTGFNQATPGTPGHVFKSTNAGQTWTNISGNLPDVPVNSIVLDPSNANTLYAGSDLGPFVTYNGGASWSPLGSGFPMVAIFQMALNPYTRQIVAATHGRGVWAITDSATKLPALEIYKTTNGLPVGLDTNLQYSVTIKNYGNITATQVVITDPLPVGTSFIAAGSGGVLRGSSIVMTLPTVPPPTVVWTDPSSYPTNTLPVGLQPGSATVTFTLHIGAILTGSVGITNDGYLAMSAEGASAVGSPVFVPYAAPAALSVSPASQEDGTQAGQVITYLESIQSLGYLPDAYTLTTTGNAWPVTVWNATHTSQITRTATLGSGITGSVIVQVAVPVTATSLAFDTAGVKFTSVLSPAASAAVSIKTIAFTGTVLLVDDSVDPGILPVYQAALNASGAQYDVWNNTANPNLTRNELKAHKIVVWYTGMAFPDPIGPYESRLAAYLDGGGRLFMSGQDILDGSAGTAPFVKNYLHVQWDDALNDVGTYTVTGVLTSPVTSGLGALPLNFTAVGLIDYSDIITPIAPAIPAFTGIYGSASYNGRPDALTVISGSYKVMFLAFPFEALDSATDRANLMTAALTWLNKLYVVDLPLVLK